MVIAIIIAIIAIVAQAIRIGGMQQSAAKWIWQCEVDCDGCSMLHVSIGNARSKSFELNAKAREGFSGFF